MIVEKSHTANTPRSDFSSILQADLHWHLLAAFMALFWHKRGYHTADIWRHTASFYISIWAVICDQHHGIRVEA